MVFHVILMMDLVIQIMCNCLSKHYYLSDDSKFTTITYKIHSSAHSINHIILFTIDGHLISTKCAYKVEQFMMIITGPYIYTRHT